MNTNTHASQIREKGNVSVAAETAQNQGEVKAAVPIPGASSEAIQQKQDISDDGNKALRLNNLQNIADRSPQATKAAQLQQIADSYNGNRGHPVQKKNDKADGVDHLKSGIENFTKYTLDDVKGLNNSIKPVQLLRSNVASSGSEIDTSPEGDKDLGREAWPLGQQKQGDIKATAQLKGEPRKQSSAIPNIVQRVPIIFDELENADKDIGLPTISIEELMTLSNQMKNDDTIKTILQEVSRRVALLPPDHALPPPLPAHAPPVPALAVPVAVPTVAEEFKQGVFSGTYKKGAKENWADLHVVGVIGGKMNGADLKAIFTDLHTKMVLQHSITGTMGTLEWHPTGAVVTKMIAELLGAALGGPWETLKAWNHKRDRKKAEAKREKEGKGVVRDKLAQKLDLDLLPEHMAHLRSLVGVSGVNIAVLAGMARPVGFAELKEDQQLKALQQNMLEKSPQGRSRLQQYEEGMKDEDQQPSMVIKVDHTKLPDLIKKIP